jgi:hypothetical protein
MRHESLSDAREACSLAIAIPRSPRARPAAFGLDLEDTLEGGRAHIMPTTFALPFVHNLVAVNMNLYNM